jgi:hypothetical protein
MLALMGGFIPSQRSGYVSLPYISALAFESKWYTYVYFPFDHFVASDREESINRCKVGALATASIMFFSSCVSCSPAQMIRG